MMNLWRSCYASSVVFAALTSLAWATDEHFQLSLRYQQETSEQSGRFHQLTRQESWRPAETAIIVCDMWDLHHCLNAVRRSREFAPRLDELLQVARDRGATIIHAPSDCMEAYADHPARQRAITTPPAAVLPDDIQSWCSRIPAEENVVYPIDQSDGGEDDDPEEHAKWAEQLRARGRNPGSPWKQQMDLITIDSEKDYITDRGPEVWSILEQRNIKNVILAGVHTNMCVLGRPFGLRQMARHGKHVVLLRDLTDTMYNPARWPYVSHFTGTDLIISHIERCVCPTITSDQILGGRPFRFRTDRRPHVVIVMADDEYETHITLPEFAIQQLGRDYRVSLVFGSDTQRNDIPGLEVLDRADLALISVRRRTLPPEQLRNIRRFVDSGKPVIGIRTASHAFCLRNTPPAEGLADWPEFDAQVFGGNYTNHYGNDAKSTVELVSDALEHPILAKIPRDTFVQGGSLYKTAPLADCTTPLLMGSVPDQPSEPVAWIYLRQDGGRSFYTSLGHPDDFHNPSFVQLLTNAIAWAVDQTPRPIQALSDSSDYRQHWSHIRLPAATNALPTVVSDNHSGGLWLRCTARLPQAWLQGEGLVLRCSSPSGSQRAWMNGHPLDAEPPDNSAANSAAIFRIPNDAIEVNEANLIVLRLDCAARCRLRDVAALLQSGERQLPLDGQWQARVGDDPSWANIPLPARYGTSTDILFEPTHCVAAN